MDYKEFSGAITWTQKYWEDRRTARKRTKPECHKYPDCSYAALRKRGNNYWLHLETMSKSELAEEIITCFLNTRRWCCHIPKPDTPEGAKVIHNLKEALHQLSAYYAALDGFRIEGIDFQAGIIIEGKEEPIVAVIDQIYYTFRQIKPQFGQVPASKLMHMALPDLFVMWDDGIIKSYGVPPDNYHSRSYVAFLILMQENIRHVIESHPYGSTVAGQEVMQLIQAEHGNLPIPRLLDMANNAVAYSNQIHTKCHECIKRANHRLDGLGLYIRATGLKKYKCSLPIPEVEEPELKD